MSKDFLKYRFLLASKSPRRAELLQKLNISYDKVDINVSEDFPDGLKPGLIAPYLAEKKSNAYKTKIENGTILLTADTVVIQAGSILEKPSDRNEAIAMLRQLSGKRHEVVTGICMRDSAKKIVLSDHSLVDFNEIPESEIEYYVDNFEPFDKAGSYGIQDWIGLAHIRSIEGSYFNIVGLPTHRIIEELEKW